MKIFKLFLILAILLIFIQSCGKPTSEIKKLTTSDVGNNNKRGTETKKHSAAENSPEYNNTKGYWENGQIITQFDCPDANVFAPVDIKYWDKVPVVNGRLPTYEETMNGTSLHHYGEKQNLYVKPYDMILPKLAYVVNLNKKTNFERNNKTGQLTLSAELVVVIQIVQTATDTIVGYRYLTGGCGGSVFRDFSFLTDEEAKKISGQSLTPVREF